MTVKVKRINDVFFPIRIQTSKHNITDYSEKTAMQIYVQLGNLFNKIKTKIYIVELEKGYWLDNWQEEYRRTAVIEYAKRFISKEKALEALIAVKNDRVLENARIIVLED